jgi:hypothetical protein
MAAADYPSLLRELRQSARQLVFDGVPWLVYELPPVLHDRPLTASLVFETDTAMRRVRNFPASWRALDDDKLFALSWSNWSPRERDHRFGDVAA